MTLNQRRKKKGELKKIYLFKMTIIKQVDNTEISMRSVAYMPTVNQRVVAICEIGLENIDREVKKRVIHEDNYQKFLLGEKINMSLD